MADIIVKNTDGKTVATISANTINEKYETALIGEKVEDYMVKINNNFVKLLENFAGDSVPPKAAVAGGAVEGQIWYNKASNKVTYRTGSDWTSNATTLDGKTLDGVREYVLAGLDTSGKLSKTGGTVTGEININGAVQVNSSVTPKTSDTSSLGGVNNRFRNLYLQEDGIRLGAASAGLTFRPHNFVYAVESDNSDVSGFPTGAIILHQETGEAIIKKSTGTFTKNNATFRKLADDKQNSAEIGGNIFKFMGHVGLVAGGWTDAQGHGASPITKLTLSTPSNGTSFGSLTYGRSHMGNGMSSGVRGVFQGGWSGYHGNHNGKMDYVVFATPGNATAFGSFGHENYGSSSVSDGTRGIVGPGYNSTGTGNRGYHYIAKYITIETPGDAAQFGTIKSSYWGSSVSSGSRGVFGGYTREGWTSKLEYITIQTPGNSLYFGNTIRHQGPHANSLSDGIKGLYFGGWRGGSIINNIEYITVATTANGADFGNCSQTGDGAGLSDGIRGVSTGGWWTKNIEYVIIQTPSNATNFGTLPHRHTSRPSSASGN